MTLVEYISDMGCTKRLFNYFPKKQILSGFNVKGKEYMVLVTYCWRGHGYKDMNIVGISLKYFSQNKEETIGLTFGNYTIYPKD